MRENFTPKQRKQILSKMRNKCFTKRFQMSSSISWKTFYTATVIQIALKTKILLCLTRCVLSKFKYKKHENKYSVFLCFFICSVFTGNPDRFLRWCVKFHSSGMPFAFQRWNLQHVWKRKKNIACKQTVCAVFSNTLLKPVFQNRNNLKKLVSRSKVK